MISVSYLSPLPSLTRLLLNNTSTLHTTLAEADVDNGSDLAPLPSSYENFEAFIESTVDTLQDPVAFKDNLRYSSFNRRLQEKYGFLTPIFANPTVRAHIKRATHAYTRAKKNNSFSPFTAHMRVPKGYLFMLIMILSRFLPAPALGLSVLFFLGLKAWSLVVLVVLCRLLYNLREGRDVSATGHVLLLYDDDSHLALKAMLSKKGLKVTAVRDCGAPPPSLPPGADLRPDAVPTRFRSPTLPRSLLSLSPSILVSPLGSPSNGYASRVVSVPCGPSFVVSDNAVSDLGCDYGDADNLRAWMSACGTVLSRGPDADAKDDGYGWRSKVLPVGSLGLAGARALGLADKGPREACDVRYNRDMLPALMPKGTGVMVRSAAAAMGMAGGGEAAGRGLFDGGREFAVEGGVGAVGDREGAVTGIVVEGGVARGAIVDGERVEADAVVSCLGAHRTLIDLVPGGERKEVPTLQLLKEERPLIRVTLDVVAAGDVPHCDFYRLPEATPGKDEVVVGEDGQRAIKRGELGDPEVTPDKWFKGKSWMRVSFPDPTVAMVWVRATDDFVKMQEAPSMRYDVLDYDGAAVRDLVEKVKADFLVEFPHCTVKGAVATPPLRQGLCHSPTRYASKCLRPATPYENLYMSGFDVAERSFEGAITAARATANAMLGYDAFDLYVIGRDVVEDLVNGRVAPPVDKPKAD